MSVRAALDGLSASWVNLRGGLSSEQQHAENKRILKSIKSQKDFDANWEKLAQMDETIEVAGKTSLHLACQYGTVDQVEQLFISFPGMKELAKEDNDKDWTSPLFVAMKHNFPVTQYLLRKLRAHLEGEFNRLLTWLTPEQFEANVTLLPTLDPQTRGGTWEYTPLHTFCRYGGSQTPPVVEQRLEALIDAGADLFAKDKWGNTPAHIAAKYNPEMLPLLCKKEPECCTEANISLQRPAHILAKYHPEYYEFIVMSTRYPDRSSNTPLHILAEKSPEYLHRYLKDNKSDITQPNYNGWIPGDYVVRNNPSEIQGLLLEKHGFDGDTTLHNFAQDEDMLKEVRKLVEAGANIWIRDSEGKKASEVASDKVRTYLQEQEAHPIFRSVYIQERDYNHKWKEKKQIMARDGVTNDLYEQRSGLSLAGRSILVLAATPLFMVKTIVLNVIRSVTDVAAKAFSILKNLKGEGIKASIKELPELPKIFASRLYRALRSPFYALAMMGTALSGVVSGNYGRRWMNQMEEAWGEDLSILERTGMKKVGNLAHSSSGDFAKFKMRGFI